ncbi:hypothetical protein B4U80_12273 [Leptotrombidium deliense]|uniref:H15 domain-containing protein n=1 Tax=Leptotrombidium deliense TaxID=299467 RepID=A0A443RWI5_9ACAR|nr:hypothetical protein B4U80_12273 [Leptotrombidium deliense]
MSGKHCSAKDYRSLCYEAILVLNNTNGSSLEEITAHISLKYGTQKIKERKIMKALTKRVKRGDLQEIGTGKTTRYKISGSDSAKCLRNNDQKQRNMDHENKNKKQSEKRNQNSGDEAVEVIEIDSDDYVIGSECESNLECAHDLDPHMECTYGAGDENIVEISDSEESEEEHFETDNANDELVNETLNTFNEDFDFQATNYTEIQHWVNKYRRKSFEDVDEINWFSRIPVLCRKAVGTQSEFKNFKRKVESIPNSCKDRYIAMLIGPLIEKMRRSENVMHYKTRILLEKYY